jgi:hypothetical protein
MTGPSPSEVLRWDGMIVASEPPTIRRLEAAKSANGHLLALTAERHPDARDEHLVGFFCECGCLDTATLTVAEHEAAGGAWCAGHRTD